MSGAVTALPLHMTTTVRTTLGLTATLLGAASQSVSAASVDAAPGFFFSTLPFTDTGTTIGAVNNINSIPSGVSNYTTVAGPDVFYTFIVSSPGTLSITLTPTGQTGYDPAFYLLTGGTLGTNAFTGRDAFTGNLPETLTTAVLNPGTYYLVVDSFYSAGVRASGAYSLNITGSDIRLADVPEPGTAVLGVAALGAAAWSRRRRGAR